MMKKVRRKWSEKDILTLWKRKSWVWILNDRKFILNWNTSGKILIDYNNSCKGRHQVCY